MAGTTSLLQGPLPPELVQLMEELEGKRLPAFLGTRSPEWRRAVKAKKEQEWEDFVSLLDGVPSSEQGSSPEKAKEPAVSSGRSEATPNGKSTLRPVPESVSSPDTGLVVTKAPLIPDGDFPGEWRCPTCEASFMPKRRALHRSMSMGKHPYCSARCASQSKVSGAKGDAFGKDAPAWLQQVYTRTYASARKGAKKRGIPFALSREDYHYLVDRCKNRCELSGLIFRPGLEKASVGTLHARRPWIPSLDRIDSTLGYSVDNCRLVCVVANIAMNDGGKSVLLELAKGLQSTPRRQASFWKKPLDYQSPPVRAWRGPYYSEDSDYVKYRVEAQRLMLLNLAEHWLPLAYAEVYSYAKGGAEKREIPFQLTALQYVALIDRCKSRCELTGIPFKSGYSVYRRHHERRLWRPSIDRINSDYGYSAENCRIVCVAVNLAMSTWGEGPLRELTRAMLDIQTVEPEYDQIGSTKRLYR